MCTTVFQFMSSDQLSLQFGADNSLANTGVSIFSAFYGSLQQESEVSFVHNRDLFGTYLISRHHASEVFSTKNRLISNRKCLLFLLYTNLK